MTRALLLLIVTLTSTIAIVLGRGRRPGLRMAIVAAVETIGATTLFLVANVLLGAVLVLAGRLLTPYYAALYEITDAMLLVLSLFQALVFEAWRRSR